jgi:hypothetical protein
MTGPNDTTIPFEALRTVVDYLGHAESQNYEEWVASGHDASRHIYEAVRDVRKWFNQKAAQKVAAEMSAARGTVLDAS